MAKRRHMTLRFRKNDPGHNLLAAAQRWVEAHGGDTLVIGGISVQYEGIHRFKVSIGCIGRAPRKKES